VTAADRETHVLALRLYRLRCVQLARYTRGDPAERPRLLETARRCKRLIARLEAAA
jgi:hypothetical protein